MTISGLIRPPSPTRFPAARYPCRRCQSEPRPQGRNEKLEPDAGKLARPVLRGGDGGNTAPLPDDTVWLTRLYVLFFIEVGSRCLHLAGCTYKPTAGWIVQQARNLVWELQDGDLPARFLLRDRDAKFSGAFDEVFRSEGVEVIRLPYRSGEFIRRKMGRDRTARGARPPIDLRAAASGEGAG